MDEKPPTTTDHLEEASKLSGSQNKFEDPEICLSTGQEDHVTPKTWLVVFALAASGGMSYWSIPSIAAISGQVSAQVGGQAGDSTWFTASFNLGAAIAFMICGANSDLFGRRWFIIGGNVLVFVGSIVGGSAKSSSAIIAGMALNGFGAGNCQLAAFALPELLPNSWRHIGVVLSEPFAYICVIVGPVGARFAIQHGEAWRWLFYGNAIANGLSGLLLVLLYFPPAHPRGVPFKRALRELDYVGMVLFAGSMVLIFVGIVYASYISDSSDAKVVAPMCTGFVLLLFFALWETFAKLKQPLTPTRIFQHNKGRSFTAPFIAGLIGSIFYLGPNIVWGTMIAVFFTTPESPLSLSLKLSMLQGIGIVIGSIGLATLGGRIKRWKWQMIISYTLMTLFGGLLAIGQPGRLAASIVITVIGGITYAWAAYLSIAYTQFGVDQEELGVAGGLAGVARFSGALIASTVYPTILNTVVRKQSSTRVVRAAQVAGASVETARALLVALPLGADAIASVRGATSSIVAAAANALTASYVKGTQTVAYASIGFGCVAIIACFFLEDIEPKMTPKIEVFLENDVNAEKNKFH